MELNEQIKAQKNNELRKRVYRTIQSMYGLFRGSALDIQIVDKYMNIWKLSIPRDPDIEPIKDVVEFPYESKRGSLAEKKNAIHCLFALVTEAIKLWHNHCKGGNCAAALERVLDKIELIVSKRLQLPIRGSEETGYYFKLPKGER